MLILAIRKPLWHRSPHWAPPRRARLLGRVDHATLAAAYASHDLLAVPSYSRLRHRLSGKRWCCGLPVLASTAGAAHEIVTNGVHGFLAPPGDAAAIAAAVTCSAHDRAYLAQMRAAAFTRYARQPTWAQSMATVSTWLAEMADTQ